MKKIKRFGAVTLTLLALLVLFVIGAISVVVVKITGTKKKHWLNRDE